MQGRKLLFIREVNALQCCLKVTCFRRLDMYLPIAETRFRSHAVQCRSFVRQSGYGIYIYIYIYIYNLLRVLHILLSV